MTRDEYDGLSFDEKLKFWTTVGLPGYADSETKDWFMMCEPWEPVRTFASEVQEEIRRIKGADA